MEGMEGLLMLLGVVLVLAGIAGTVLPALPGAPLAFVGLLLVAWADDFQKVGWFTLVIVGLLAALTFPLDIMAASLGAKRVGASWLALVGAAIGTVVGFFFGLPGLLLGPFIGAVAGEYLSRRDLRQAGRVGVGTWVGFVIGVAGKMALIFMMIGVFAFAYMV
ncbi:MAG TPA: DUF456 domain-containing protein [Thermoanaerobaculia bacterium]